MNKKCHGFTLIEMLVSVAVIGIMVTVITIGFRGVQSAPRSLNLAIQEVSSIINLAQDYSKASYNCCNDKIIYGYGIYFDLDNDQNQYHLFADKNNNFTYDGELADEILDTIYISSNVEFYSEWYDYQGAAPNTTGSHSITFPISPGPAYLDGNEITENDRVGFIYSNGPRYKYLFINGLTGRLFVDPDVYEEPVITPPQ